MTIDKHADLPAPGEPGAPTPEDWLAQADKPVPEGVRDISQDPLFDPEIDNEEDHS